jgi:hypothetical protein
MVKLNHLRDLKNIDPFAYQQYVEMLIEDCKDTFTVRDDNKLEAVVKGDSFQPGITMTFENGAWNEEF